MGDMIPNTRFAEAARPFPVPRSFVGKISGAGEGGGGVSILEEEKVYGDNVLYAYRTPYMSWR